MAQTDQLLIDALQHVKEAHAALQARIAISISNNEPAGHLTRNRLNVAKAWLESCEREIKVELRKTP